ncbi:MAG: aminotransferase class IV [Chloroflexi bacterium]|nr:aminotransferase class IV [Chloroflexota bacterium]
MKPVVVGVLGRGLVDPDSPVLTADDAALARGMAAFETIRVDDGVPFALQQHLDRLAASAARLGLPPVALPAIDALARGAVAATDLAEAGLRLYWTGGPDGGPATVIVTITPVPADTESQRARGLRVVSLELGIDRAVRVRSSWLLAGVKSTSYAVHVAALTEAKRQGADDALFLATDGTVLEGATSNVWWMRDGVLRTPSLDTGILAGVTRAHLLEVAPRIGLAVEEGAWGLEELAASDEVILSSSVREVVGVIDVDGRPVGDGRPGPVAAALQAGLRAMVRERRSGSR